MHDSRIQLDIGISTLGMRIHVPESELAEFQAGSVEYIGRRFSAKTTEVLRYLDEEGVIQCRQIRRNGKRCRNTYGVHACPGKIEFRDWLKLDRAGWYCRIHGE